MKKILTKIAIVVAIIILIIALVLIVKSVVSNIQDSIESGGYVDALGHTDGEWIVDKEATCTEDGSKHQICSVCGETIKTEAISKKDHEYVPVVTVPTCIMQGYTTHTCSCGDSFIDSYVDALGHTDGEWIVDKEATTTEEGSKHQVCSVCGDTIKIDSYYDPSVEDEPETSEDTRASGSDYDPPDEDEPETSEDTRASGSRYDPPVDSIEPAW